ncbi:MAG: DUF1015 domain-containing protein [Lachnospiraceae bacterium]|jgi:uncharacterized protein (DUF1015 family)|nr:DUF1015 domain-containing protein [Lachnospiraceae bacterium]
MAVVKPFRAVRPNAENASQVAALPYDVYSRKEALEAVKGNPLSFLNIDRGETQFPDEVDIYADCVYEKARELLDARIEDGTFIQDETPCYYIYRLTMNGRSQTGIVACSSVDDYQNQVIKKHENTREEKEQDRICHVDATDAHTGPIFLAYLSLEKLDRLTARVCLGTPIYDFVSDDGIGHTVWKIAAPGLVKEIEEAFLQVPATYIADGHHRAASAVKVGLKRQMEHPDDTGEEPYHYFLSVLFPDEQLMIMPYNRVVKDLNGLSKDEFLNSIKESFTLSQAGPSPYAPEKKGTFGMYLDGQWYRLEAKPEIISNDPVKGLDVSLLQDFLLGPILGIGDPRTDKRIDFIGGIRGLKELEKRTKEDMEVAFSMYATSIQELLNVADAGLLMPPKSTWFEPKLRSGLFIHKLSE